MRRLIKGILKWILILLLCPLLCFLVYFGYVILTFDFDKMREWENWEESVTRSFFAYSVVLPLRFLPMMQHPSDEKMMKHFYKNKNDFEILLKMLLEDKFGESYYDYNSIHNIKNFSESRNQEYEKLSKKLKIKDIHIPPNLKNPAIEFRLNLQKRLYGRNSAKGYFWFSYLPAEVQRNSFFKIEDYVENPIRNHGDHILEFAVYDSRNTFYFNENLDALDSLNERRYKGDSLTSRTLTAIRPIEGKWYLYLKEYSDRS